MGSEMARNILNKRDLELVGAVVRKKEDVGKDISSLIGLRQKTGIRAYDVKTACRECDAELLLHAAVSYVPMVWEQVKPFVESGLNVVTIAEEMGYPFVKYKALSKKMDLTAKKHDVSILGTGINPGFAMDIMPLLLTGICRKVNSIKVTRLIDFSPFGPSIQKNIGIGMDKGEFRKKVAGKQLPLHIGLPETMHMLAASLKWKLSRVYETREPVLANNKINIPGYMNVAKGKVAGFNHRCFGLVNKKLKITLEELGRVDPKLDYRNTIEIRGMPNLMESVNVPPGNYTTTSHAVNLIPVVVNAKSGLLSMLDLPVAPVLPERT